MVDVYWIQDKRIVILLKLNLARKKNEEEILCIYMEYMLCLRRVRVEALFQILCVRIAFIALFPTQVPYI